MRALDPGRRFPRSLRPQTSPAPKPTSSGDEADVGAIHARTTMQRIDPHSRMWGKSYLAASPCGALSSEAYRRGRHRPELNRLGRPGSHTSELEGDGNETKSCQ